jgi:hypothetical protein
MTIFGTFFILITFYAILYIKQIYETLSWLIFQKSLHSQIQSIFFFIWAEDESPYKSARSVIETRVGGGRTKENHFMERCFFLGRVGGGGVERAQWYGINIRMRSYSTIGVSVTFCLLKA